MLPDPDPLSLAPCSLGPGRCAPALPVPAASLTAAVRGAPPDGRSGRRDGSYADRTKGCALELNSNELAHHAQFAELDAHN